MLADIIVPPPGAPVFTFALTQGTVAVMCGIAALVAALVAVREPKKAKRKDRG